MLTILLIISIVFAFCTYEKLNDKTKLANQIFIGNLSVAKSGFGVDYSKLNEDQKMFYYLQISSSLGIAMNTLDLTSYNDIKNRNELFIAINDLYWCMTRSDSRKEILTDRALVYKYLSEIILNAEDEKNCKALSKLAGDLYFNGIK